MPKQFLDPLVAERVRVRTRGYLPHWEVENATYFVTFRERDSLPRHVAERLKEERVAIQRAICGDAAPNAIQRSEIRAAFFARVDSELDHGYGRCRLREHADLAAHALKYFDGERYEVCAWCVMQNHVHVIFSALEPLAKTIHTWKSFIAHRIGEPVFAPEYFDRIIRNDRDLDETVAYVRANPQKARLKHWPFVG